MNRRHFIQKSSTLGIALLAIPSFAFGIHSKLVAELLGKQKPELFGTDYQLRYDAHIAFETMRTAASNDGIKIQVVSSYRSFDHQKSIWNKKYKRYINQGLEPKKAIQKIIEYSTIPGTSRHHWGTDIDIVGIHENQPKNVFQLQHFETGGIYFKFQEWMLKNAHIFGFYLPYTNDTNRQGFKYEPWHYSYKPLSSTYLTSYKSIVIQEHLKNENLLGMQHFSDEFMDNYRRKNILDINPELL